MKKRTAGPNWDDVRMFCAVADHGTLSAAAHRLAVTHATVSRRLDRLEETLGVRLFDRTPEGYRLTTAGLDLLARVQPARIALTQITEQTTPEAPLRGTVTVSVVPSLADGVLTERLSGFCRRHPDLRLDLLITSRSVSILRREADLAVRLARPTERECITRKLGDIGYRLCGTVEVLARYHAGDAVPGITFSDDLADLPEARWMAEAFGTRIQVRSNTLGVQRAAAAAGLGLALLPRYMLPWPGLIPVDPGPGPVQREVWLLVRPDGPRRPGVRAVMDHLITMFREAREALL